MIETYRGVVRPHQLDHMGHMNVQWYTAKFDEASWHLFSTVGLTNTYFHAENRGMAAVKQTTHYKAEAMAGDLLICRTEVLEMTDKTIRFIHHMLDPEKNSVVATSELVGVHLDRKLRKACLLPDAIRKEIKRLIPDASVSG